ncbi:outer membrane protein assembly factor BamD [Sandaracinus amylolyticus]|uniref:Outer membrane lipoprotein BamD-like domain-containing protein n=1 Tax=Sandaracinus amylolyticus TaxID=927083 RepID=A0A0F6YL95_9BACT|nr:outer membrane protein assembly factor BamD [Sandaracinus amylolyticus]AKF09170.1 hypothetical protein DB32_006319 [Sandaracinus amylolyticus]
MPDLRLYAPVALVLALAACGGSQQGAALSYGESARRDYERALAAVEDNDCLTAAPLLQNVRREYPYSRYAALAELRLADCELSQQHYTEAIRAYRSFIRQRPTHAEIDTANYSIARAYFQQIPTDFFLSPPPEERDQAATRSALRVVRRFLADYPESEHVEDARRIERQVLDLLARHELYVASYYLNRDQPHATISRIQTLLSEYDGSGVVPEALLLMGRTYLHMREQRDARLAFGELVDRFPRSGYAVQARNYLRTMGSTDPVDAPEPEDQPRRPSGGRGIEPGTDIDDVTGDDRSGLGGSGTPGTDSLEDTSEMGIEVRGTDVEAADLERGRTSGAIEEDIQREERERAADEIEEDIADQQREEEP